MKYVLMTACAALALVLITPFVAPADAAPESVNTPTGQQITACDVAG